jgi:N-acetylmuramoyl-L-alanine amidase
MAKRKQTDYIVIHCSATKPSMDIGTAEIRKWHKDKGWSDIGYHAVIRRNGIREQGRNLDEIGAHVSGFNSLSVGICLVGGISEKGLPENNFTKAQFSTLKKIVSEYKKLWPTAIVQGHRDFPGVYKECPCFDAIDWWRKNG